MTPKTDAPRLSKRRFLAGLQCHKQLWWLVREPGAPELAPGPVRQNLFDQGTQVGRVARDYVAGADYEPAFFADHTHVAVDILERRPEGSAVVEVKATNRVKPEHIPDVAIQVHVLRQAGLPVERAEVMHLNPECHHPDLSNLFVREEVTPKVEAFLPMVPDEIAAQLRMLAGPLPVVPIGEHCTKPRDCPFLARCWPTLPEHHVSTLYRIQRSKVLEYQAQGYETIHDLPSDLELSVIHARQVEAVSTGRMVMKAALADALTAFGSPLAFLDFETVSLAIPVWNGCHPWETVPAQFSCHVEGSGGRLVHHAFIAEGPADPRPVLAERLVSACARARGVVAYFASFEQGCLRNLAAAVPELATELREIEAKLLDLLPVIRNHVYHPDFGGSFSIKSVLPALVPGLSYQDLEIRDGEIASVELMRLLFEAERLGPEAKAPRRDALLRYCERDSWALVKLLEQLRRLAQTQQLELF